MLSAEPVMHFTGGFSRRGEGELVGMDLHVQQEQVGAVLQLPGDHMGHARTHLVLDHRVCALDKEAHEFFVALGISQQVQDILDDLPAVIEPEPELFIVQCQCNVLAGILGILVPYQGKIECTFRCLAAITDTGNGRAGAGSAVRHGG